MITSAEIWRVLDGRMPYDKWVPLQEIYGLVEKYGNLGDEDNANPAVWRKRARAVLQNKRKVGQIVWAGNANYKLV